MFSLQIVKCQFISNFREHFLSETPSFLTFMELGQTHLVFSNPKLNLPQQFSSGKKGEQNFEPI